MFSRQYWPVGKVDILDVGSLNVNGSPKDSLTPEDYNRYIGVDLQAGPGVDVVADVKDLVSLFNQESFDVVVSTGTLEHMADWRVAVYQMSAVLRVGGILCLTTCSPGFEYHPYPIDVWRFTKEQLANIFQAPMAAEHLEMRPDMSRGRLVEPGVIARRMDKDLEQWRKRLHTLEVSKP